MKRKVFIRPTDSNEIVIIIEDGGIADIYHTGEYFLTTYFQARVTPEKLRTDDIWEGDLLQECKQYSKEWEGEKHITTEMIIDACKWLDVSFDENNYEILISSYESIADELEKFKNK